MTDTQDLTVAEIEQLIADASDSERETLKAQLRADELDSATPRKGVLEATEPIGSPPAAAQAPATPDEDDELLDAVSASERDAKAENDRIAKAAADSGQVSLADAAQE